MQYSRKKCKQLWLPEHSFANCLKQKRSGPDVISESLGNHRIWALLKPTLTELDTEIVDRSLSIYIHQDKYQNMFS